MSLYRKVLFPTDYSCNSDHALAHAIRLTNFRDGELIIQHVASDYFDRTPHWISLFDVRELQLHMDSFAQQEMAKTLASIGGGVTIRPIISRGRVVKEIVALAEKEFVDLIVMGSAAGTVTDAVIRSTSRPVLAISSHVQPPAALAGSACRILVATDLSEHSRKVVRYAIDLQKEFGATIYLLYVIETSRAVEFALSQEHCPDATGRMKEWAMNQLLKLVPDESLHDPRVIRIVETGIASERIASVAHKFAVDLTVLGTHEYGSMHKHLLETAAGNRIPRLESPLLTV